MGGTPAATLAALLLLGAPLRATAQFESLCFPSYQFQFAIEDPYTQRTWRWDLSTLCRSSGSYSYSGFGTEGQTFNFNVAGNTSFYCSDYVSSKPMYESWGVAMQMLQDSRGVNPRDDCLRADNTTCTDWTYGGDICCSPRRCEIVALEPAVFSPLNKSNLATGGVLLKHAGYPDSDNDFLACPEQAPGLRRVRTFELNLACDPAGSAYDLIVTGYNEGDDGEDGQYCRFQVYVSTLAACGTPDPLPTPAPAPQASASDVVSGMILSGDLATRGSQFGYVLLGIVLTFAGQFAFARGAELRSWALGEGRVGGGNGLSFPIKAYGVAGAQAAAPLQRSAAGYGGL